jgi:hypothetical protein
MNNMNWGMWILASIFFGPFILWALKLLIIEPISDKINDTVKKEKRGRYFGEEIITDITTYQNNNITEEDIINLFQSQWKNYRCRYYTCEHKVYSEKDKQNYSWKLKTRKNTYGWGIIYNIELYFSNGWFFLKFSDNKFKTDNISSEEYFFYGHNSDFKVERELKNCMEEAKIMWKSNGKEPSGYLPFDFYSINSNKKTSSTSDSDKRKKYKKTSTEEQSYTNDLIGFYRNLLGLRLNYTQEELKNAYREAVTKYHPDSYGTASSRDQENAELIMKQINEAYEVLRKWQNKC